MSWILDLVLEVKLPISGFYFTIAKLNFKLVQDKSIDISLGLDLDDIVVWVLVKVCDESLVLVSSLFGLQFCVWSDFFHCVMIGSVFI